MVVAETYAGLNAVKTALDMAKALKESRQGDGATSDRSKPQFDSARYY
jgi:hypothetical protein